MDATYVTHFLALLLVTANVGCRPSTAAAATGLSVKHREAYGSPLRIFTSSDFLHITSSPLREFLQVGLALTERTRRRRRLASLASGNGSQPSFGRPSFGYTISSPNDAEFYVTLRVGVPEQSLTFILDTGSELIWSQCNDKPCDGSQCGGAGTDLVHYDAWRSNTAAPVPCGGDGEVCYGSATVQMDLPCNSTCSYQVGYADGTTGLGGIWTDEIDLQRQDGTSDGSWRKRLALGCTTRLFSFAFSLDSLPGILGLNPAPYSFVSQLLGSDSTASQKFAYCFPPTFSALTTAGTLLLGNYGLPPASFLTSGSSNSTPSLTYTPLQFPRSTSGSIYYYVDLQNITVGNATLPPPAAFNAADMINVQGTIFDSGTGLTRLATPIYVDLVRQLRNQTKHLHPFSLQGGDLCYRVPLAATELPELPAVRLTFGGGAVLEWESADLLYSITTNSTSSTAILCLAVLDGGQPPTLNIIGNYQQRGRWIEYDISGRRIGFAKADCSQSGTY